MRSRNIICVALAALLALPPFSVAARAEESGEVRAQAQRQNVRLQELVDELEQGRAEVDQLNQQINDLADQSIALQGTLIEDRQNLATTVATTYRSGGMPSIIDMLLASEDVDDFVANLYYAQKVADWQAERIRQLKADKLELERTMELIEDSRNERGLALDVLDTTREALQSNIDALYARAAMLEDEERAAEEARLAEIARQAKLEEERRQEEEAKRQAAAEVARQEEARLEAERQAAQEQEQEQAATEAARDEVARQQAEEAARQEAQAQAEAQAQEQAERAAAEEQAAAERAAQEQAAQEQQAVPEPEQEPVDTSSASDWITCIASAYTIADNDPPGSTATASGIPLDDSVPTVAMPMSMDPARFYGSRIQIEYEGMTVIATVTDCGYMAGGARGLDLSTAVFRAFGFYTADDWGLREVRYRFL